MKGAAGWPIPARRAVVTGLLVASLVSTRAGGVQTPQPTDSATVGSVSAATDRPHPREKTLLKRRWGVEVRGVRLSGAGTMLEFRYKVLDRKKATPLFERKTKPVLVHERTGAQLAVPRPAKTGPLCSSDPPIEGRTYWMFFVNPGQLVKPGEEVTVVIGEFRAAGLVVE